MKTINNRQELNQYYITVDIKLKQYIDEYKVSPGELLHYVKSNLKEIKEEIGMLDVLGIDKVILDVVHHYNHSHLDKILKFESFKNRLR